MKAAVIAFTHRGALLCERLTAALNAQAGIDARGFSKQTRGGLCPIETDLAALTASLFDAYDALIFIGAAGIAVRAVAPYIKSKTTDPAVLVADEGGRFVIPVLSGHIGGANSLARTVAALLSATPVITTATDINGVFAADEWAARGGCAVANPEMIKVIASALLAGDKVGFVSDFPVAGEYPPLLGAYPDAGAGICVTLDPEKRPYKKTLILVPRCVTVGVGCRRGTAAEVLERRLCGTLAAHAVPLCAVRAVATVELKADEPALLAFCKKYRLPLQTYTAAELREAPGEFTASEFVKKTVGVDNVCERAAMLAGGGALVLRKTGGDGVTVAAAKQDWRGNF